MTIDHWIPFFEAEVAAAAALAGLLFVALSINLARIIAVAGLPERAGITLSLLIAVVVISSLVLIPDQTPVELGVELAIFGIAHTIFVYVMRSRVHGSAAEKLSPVPGPVREFANPVTTVPIVVAGALELAGVPGALYWLPPPGRLS